MNVLILGAGGREHAFAWKISQSSKLSKLFIAPGNAGTSAIGENLNIDITDFQKIKSVVLHKEVDLVVVGPEAPLVDGITDFFRADVELQHIKIIGPPIKGAMLEGSKDFAKEFMRRHNIPTAAYNSFTAETIEEAYSFLETLGPPYVLKADGLAAGKGVLILQDLDDAKKELHTMLVEAKFGSASAKVVIEEFLSGVELSCFVLTDSANYLILPNAKDYKRIGEGDTGLNTGGMGAISPVPFADTAFMEKIETRIVIPTIKGLIQEEIPYCGFIFIGLIKVGEDPYVIEYNVRMGDPETEVVLPRIKNDLLDLLDAAATGNLNQIELAVDKQTATTVMAVSGGYPEAYEKGKKISGLNGVKDSIIFHAGTRVENGDVLTNGGRVIAVTSLGTTIEDALTASYRNLEGIDFEGMYYRKDLGFDL